ncbi:bifunctional homocysteine S-methyltransferase/methylenetetrahydrofolate reductase [Myxococcota bacterium]|nr:bifunctional homocysteine S-methyltransferase/methylenetetrahydrofolate reductase [Myxococcota bacterium]
MAEGLLRRMALGPVVFDGAMGTQIYARGIYINRNFEELNVSRPDLIRKIHEDYLAAGAEVLTTNTFGANPNRLARHGLEARLGEIVEAGIALARDVSRGRAFVVASVGPSGLVPDPTDPSSLEDIRGVFRRTLEAVVGAGVDGILFETFRHPLEMQIALAAARAVGPGVPLLATMVFDQDRRTGDGLTPEVAADRMARWGADVVGANCGEGPAVLSEVVPRMTGAGRPVLVQPNAGMPRRIEGRVMYMATPEYFGEHAKRWVREGIRGVGGCCGTTPDHIRQVSSEVRMVRGGRIEMVAVVEGAGHEDPEVRAPVPLDRRSALGRCLAESFVVSVEVDPPVGTDPARALEGARMLRDGGVRFVNIADGPRATVRMSPLALGVILKDRLGLDPILHVTCRDRNLLGLQSDLLGAQSLGLSDLLVITGDPAKLGDYPSATTVYDLDSVGLLRLISNLNRGVDPSGRRLDVPTSFVKGCGAEPAALDLEREVARLRAKVDAGAEFVMTQPVFDPGVLDRFLKAIEGIRVPVLMGLLPLASYRNAEFLHNEVPGVTIPEEVRDRMRKAGSGAEARAEGVRIAQEMARIFLPRVQGLYLMPPFERYETALAVLEGLPIPSCGGKPAEP